MSGGGARSSFFVAFRVLPRRERRAIEAVYGFCRRADDAVDEAPDVSAGRRALDAVARELDALYDARSGGCVDARLGEAIRDFGLPRAPFDRLLEGVSWDLEGRRYATVEDLREYCSRVASSVGLLCVRIFGCADRACDRYAEELGIALQWTNILRDLAQDLARGRVYLPRASFDRVGVRPEDLLDRRAELEEPIGALVRAEAAYARTCFGAAARALPAAERRRLLAGRIMGAVYESLLGKIERAGAGVLDRRIRVSGGRRGALALRLLLEERLGLA